MATAEKPVMSGYKDRMDKGTYALFRLHHDGHIYNAAMVVTNGVWRTGEINSRFNSGGVPEGVRRSFGNMVRTMSNESAVAAQRGSEAAQLRIKARFSVL